MKIDIGGTLDAIKDGTKEAASFAHEKTSEFHEKYVSKVVPDFGKFGGAAKFAAEMAPGVSEYNAIKDGDWTGFAISAGIDVAAIAVGAFTAGAGYGAIKGGTTAAKAGVKVAAKEVAEAGAKKAAKEIAEAGAEKVVKEIAEAGTEKIVKEIAEAGAEKAVKEIAEAGTEKVVKEIAEAGAEKAVKEIAEAGVEKTAKEIAEAGAEKTAKEIAEAGAEKITKEAGEVVAKEVGEKVGKETGEKIAKEAGEKVARKAAKEVGEQMNKELVPSYIKEVAEKTNRIIPDNQLEQITKVLKDKDFVKLSPEDTNILRRKFNNSKNRLIHEWETNTGFKWPRYIEDVVNEAGEVIRVKGQPYDAHHLIELNFGGPNEWWNLHPVSTLDHQKVIHGVESLANIIF